MAVAAVAASIQELNAHALAGDIDAAILLANRSKCKTLTEFITKYVPREEQVMVFNVFCDGWRISRERRAKAKTDTVEIPAVKAVKAKEKKG